MATQTRQLATATERRRRHSTRSDDELRRFIARELHDRVAQTLTTMLIELANFRGEQTGQPNVVVQLDEWEAAIREVLSSLRELVHDLRGETQLLSEAFAEVVGRLLADFERQTGIKTELTVDDAWPARLKPPASVNLCRIIGEALVNVRRHSGAKNVAVALQPHGPAGLSITVADDGRGCETLLDGYPGVGIAAMRERATLLGASLVMGSPDRAGTTVSLIVPQAAVSERR